MNILNEISSLLGIYVATVTEICAGVGKVRDFFSGNPEIPLLWSSIINYETP